jgi:type II secretory pathway component PulF
MYLLLNSGLPIISALELTRDVVFKAKTAKLISASREVVMSGKRLSDGFRLGKGYLPSIMIKLIESGEKSGTLDKSMKEISEYLDYQVTNALKAFTAILEPVMLILVGISVGGMMISIMAPIYGLIGQVGGR